MAVYFSFHYDRDHWRVQQVVQMGAVEGQPILNSQDWEAVKRKGDQAIKNWVHDQMRYKSAVVVLIGAQTASRRWVRYEIGYAWDIKKPLVGVRIHGLVDKDGSRDGAGENPFAQVSLKGGGTTADYVPVYNPTGSTGREVYDNIKRGLPTWVASAYKRS